MSEKQDKSQHPKNEPKPKEEPRKVPITPDDKLRDRVQEDRERESQDAEAL